jgi:anaerobic selenocysteine-containing dehydrogenase
MTEWEMIEATLKASGLPDADTLHRNHWHDCSLSFESMHFLDGFGHPDGKFRFKPDWKGMGMDGARLPALPDFAPINDTVDKTYPFRLVTAPARQYLNTTFTETPGSQERERRPTVLVHPVDCARLGIAEGQRVRVGSRQASIVVHARPFDGLQPGVLVIESIWPNSAFEEGIGVNALVSDEPGPPKGGGTFHDTAAWLRPA